MLFICLFERGEMTDDNRVQAADNVRMQHSHLKLTVRQSRALLAS